MPKSGERGYCYGCGKAQVLHAALGGRGDKVCHTCYDRWRRLGRPGVLPPARGFAWGAYNPAMLGPGACMSCKREVRKRYSRGWCRTCYRRWLESGKPDELPDIELPPAGALPRYAQEVRARRLAQLFSLISQGVTRVSDQADRMGVSREMVRQYHKWAREARADPQLAGSCGPPPTEQELGSAEFTDEELLVARDVLDGRAC